MIFSDSYDFFLMRLILHRQCILGGAGWRRRNYAVDRSRGIIAEEVIISWIEMLKAGKATPMEFWIIPLRNLGCCTCSRVKNKRNPCRSIGAISLQLDIYSQMSLTSTLYKIMEDHVVSQDTFSERKTRDFSSEILQGKSLIWLL